MQHESILEVTDTIIIASFWANFKVFSTSCIAGIHRICCGMLLWLLTVYSSDEDADTVTHKNPPKMKQYL
jgi:hypothetical protein